MLSNRQDSLGEGRARRRGRQASGTIAPERAFLRELALRSTLGPPPVHRPRAATRPCPRRLAEGLARARAFQREKHLRRPTPALAADPHRLDLGGLRHRGGGVLRPVHLGLVPCTPGPLSLGPHRTRGDHRRPPAGAPVLLDALGHHRRAARRQPRLAGRRQDRHGQSRTHHGADPAPAAAVRPRGAAAAGHRASVHRALCRQDRPQQLDLRQGLEQGRQAASDPAFRAERRPSAAGGHPAPDALFRHGHHLRERRDLERPGLSAGRRRLAERGAFRGPPHRRAPGARSEGPPLSVRHGCPRRFDPHRRSRHGDPALRPRPPADHRDGDRARPGRPLPAHRDRAAQQPRLFPVGSRDP